MLSRNIFDKNGNEYDNPEWSSREAIFFNSYESAVNSPEITDEELVLLGYKFDEDGMLIGDVDVDGRSDEVVRGKEL